CARWMLSATASSVGHFDSW
nr:immunoglobulin heavy chain junction region [Macaca mulatta]MOY18299.1 immunoglobulin heavy chain junction region [Macaca mulatta]MOY19410.1 immunoglobulin heavy chain junction region [Macaca mulatta]MOY19507.1 immunoglobulin heavy chain junction region [Macaca mulatta]MOY20046.1 immunoglobulin heavy chain junction region [Macaca mulatta]